LLDPHGSLGNRNVTFNTFFCTNILSSAVPRAPTTFKLEGEVTSLSESSQGEVGDNTVNREKWGDFWEKLIAINRNIVSQPL
jgi:hypothetical protein